MATNVPHTTLALMTIEINRISSLANFKPSWMRPSACLLARWGFYWDGKSENVLICVYCRQTADRTILEDNPVERHRRKNPICPMFKDNTLRNPPSFAHEVLRKFDIKARRIPALDSTDYRQGSVLGNDISTVTVVSPSVLSLIQTLQSCVDRASSHGVFTSNTTLFPAVLNRLDPDFQMLCNEATRLATFHDWPADAQAVPQQLAKAGFFYTGSIDRVQCAFCRGFLKNWVASDIPIEEHRNHMPACRFVQGTATDNESVDGDYLREAITVQSVSDSRHKNLDLRGDEAEGLSPPMVNLGTIVARKAVRRNMPGHPEFTDETKRMQSFINKTIPRGQNVNVLANAGFFHVGPIDNTKCFYCNGGLRNWCPSDDPWVEHTRWFPQCGFLRSRRDPGYIKVIQDAFRPTLKAIEDWKATHGTRDDESPSFEAVATPEPSSAPAASAADDTATPAAAAACEDTTVTGPDDASKNISKANKKKNKKKKNKAAKRDQKNDESTTQEVTAAERTQAEADKARAVFDENRTLHESKTCKVCMDEDVNVVFLPCGHLACCNNCAPSLPHCPICRGLIRGTVRVFLS